MRQVKHGHNRKGKVTKTYHSWNAMKQRCSRPNHDKYYMYGAVGITYDPKWESFEGFLGDMGERPIGTTLDRIDSKKGYYKENCRWATPK